MLAASAMAHHVGIVSDAAGTAPSKPGLYVGVVEQFTHFGTLQEDGEKIANDVGQYLDGFVTEFIVGYRFHKPVAVQLNVPHIHRVFKRADGFDIERGTESGLGDVALAGHVRVFEIDSEDARFVGHVFGGVKFPTGDSGRLEEELHHHHVPGAPESGIHGHDLALGSGSFDGVVGGSMFARWHRLYATARIQYAIRSEGDFGYRYANDLVWSGGPGVYFWQSHESTLGLRLNVSGETKGKDKWNGAKMDDTAHTNVFLGPELAFAWEEHLRVDVGADLPVVRENSALQIVPDYRIRFAATWQF
jgi:hypothetical protein